MTPEKRKRPGAARTARTRHERSAGGIVFRRVDDEPLFLIIRDSYGNWGFPKGHLERGERADTAALREVMEETGLRAIALVGAIDTIEWFFRFRGALIHKRCEFFLMETSAERTRPQESEGITECRWASLEEARRLVPYENARALLTRAHALVTERAEAS